MCATISDPVYYYLYTTMFDSPLSLMWIHLLIRLWAISRLLRVTTGILFMLFLKKNLSNLQWIAIILLAVGTTTSQVKGYGQSSWDSLLSVPIQGNILCLRKTLFNPYV